MNDSVQAVILHTMKGENYDELFAVFTDEERFVNWAEDFVKKNPNVDLYYTILALDPAPGKMGPKRFESGDTRKVSFLEEALSDLDDLKRIKFSLLS